MQRNHKFKENLQTTNQNQSELEALGSLLGVRRWCEEKQTLEEQSRAANEVLFKKKKVAKSLIFN